MGKAKCCGENFHFVTYWWNLFLGMSLCLDFLEFLESSASRISHDWLFFYLDYDRIVIDAETMIIPDRFSMGGNRWVFLSACFPSLHGYFLNASSMGSLLGLLDSLKGMLIGAGLLYWIGAWPAAVWVEMLWVREILNCWGVWVPFVDGKELFFASLEVLSGHGFSDSSLNLVKK